LFSFVGPYLLAAIALVYLLRMAGLKISKWPGKFIVICVPLAVILFPMKHVPIARLPAGLNVNFSITSIAVLLSLYLQNIQGVRLLDRAALRAISILGLVPGLLLYPSAMNIVPFDLYQLGWGSGSMLALLFFLTIFLVCKGNRAGFVLAACVAAYALKLLESDNLWDYLADPFLLIWCLINVLVECARLSKLGDHQVCRPRWRRDRSIAPFNVRTMDRLLCCERADGHKALRYRFIAHHTAEL